MGCPPERIVLCVDACEELDAPKHVLWKGGKPLSPFEINKKCVELFMHHKSLMNPEHQFAILVFKNAYEVMYGFNKKWKTLMASLNSVKVDRPFEARPYQLDSIFRTVFDKVSKHPPTDSNQSSSLRFIILYSRPTLCHLEKNVLKCHKNVTTDLVFIHRPITSKEELDKNSVIFAELQNCLDEGSLSYPVLNTYFKPLKVMAYLLVHPEMRAAKK